VCSIIVKSHVGAPRADEGGERSRPVTDRLRPSHAALVLASTLVLVASLVLVDLPGSSASEAGGRAVRVAVPAMRARAALGRPVPVQGTVVDSDTRRPVARARVTLEVRTRSGWSAVPGVATSTDTQGRFSVAAPTFYYGRHVFRASAEARLAGSTAVVTGSSASGVVTVTMPYRPSGGTGSGKADATRFDPCTPIAYRINFSGAPRNARRLVSTALAKARAATGLTFTYAGPTNGIPFSNQRNSGLPPSGITFAWATPRQVHGLAGTAIGLGGGGWAEGHRRTSSGVVIDRTFHFRRGWKAPNSIGGLLLHELGHALGLEHVRDRRQIMYPLDIGSRTGNYGRGDLAAFRKVGLDAGCL
jgi:hypothetical protein